MLAAQDRTLIDRGLQNGGLFTFFVYVMGIHYKGKKVILSYYFSHRK